MYQLDHWNSLILSKESNGSVISDVWDAAHITGDKFFTDARNVAVSLFSDGVPIFKSSKTAMWPVYYSILNLPASIRTKSKNIILSGLWVGPGKPSFDHLLAPLMEEINHLTTVGVTIELPTGDVTVKAKLVLDVFDLPAKAAVLSYIQFNGKYGCSVCLHPGKYISHRRIYPPRKTSMRTHDQMISFGQETIECGKPKKGVKCISSLADYLDLVDSIPVDYMHAVLEGVMGKLLTLWFETRNNRKSYYLGRSVKAIDSLLMQQTPPDDFSRATRCIATHRKYWKATELKQWPLYYSLPLLQSKLPPLYWHHYCLLVCTMHILLKDKISLSELDAADIMIRDFLKLFAPLYGEINFAHNFHLHNPCQTKYIQLWGPLWTHSAFCFENKNGLIKSLFHGTSQQILFNVNTQCTIHSLIYDIKLSDGDTVASYLSEDYFKSNMIQITEYIYAVGNSEHVILTKDQEDALQCQASDRVQVFYRLFNFGVMYHCTQYARQRCSKQNNTFCEFRHHEMVQIIFDK